MSAVNQLGKYQPYPDYKDSGVEWLGIIPENWIVTCIKRLSSNAVKSFTDGDWIESPHITDTGVRLIQTGNIGIGKYKEQGYRYISNDTFIKLRCTEVKPNDVLICRLAEPVGRACLAPSLRGKMLTSVDVSILKLSKDIDERYVVYFLTSNEYLGHLNSAGRGGTRQRIARSDLGDTAFVLPSINEQRTIAAFLDYETARIDQLIAKQQQLIELLKEKRQAVISHAVTKGLNPNAPMKDSGVEWLGQVPEHWVVKRLKHISPKIGVGLVINPSTYVKDDGVYFLFGGDIEEYGFKLEKTRKMSDEDSRSLPQSRLNEGDLVCVRVGYPGITAVIPKLLCGSNCASMMVVRRGLYDSHWLAYCMNSDIGRKQVELVQYGAAQKQYNIADAIEFYFAVPPLAEQKQISEYLYDERKKFNSLITNAENIIALLQERRTALISAAVTGKIDLRGWQPPKREVAA